MAGRRSLWVLGREEIPAKLVGDSVSAGSSECWLEKFLDSDFDTLVGYLHDGHPLLGRLFAFFTLAVTQANLVGKLVLVGAHRCPLEMLLHA